MRGVIINKLLIRGYDAFNEIISCINAATTDIEIQMFIWRDDIIGNKVLDALLKAAKRNVKITINKDTYGVMFEKGEEMKQSMFHKISPKRLYFSKRLIEITYNTKENPKKVRQKENMILDEFLKHRNVHINQKIDKNHTKYYIFDQKILIIGGINIEDKEYNMDLQKRVYEDYMVKIVDENVITKFNKRMKNIETFNEENNIDFIVNTDLSFESLDIFTKLINNATKDIKIAMAYFGNKHITKAIINAKKRGISVSIISSEHSNVQPHLNKRVFKKLIKNNIDIYLYKGLIHAKSFLIDDTLIIGSTNFSNGSMYKLKEAAIYTKDQQLILAYNNNYTNLIKSAKKHTIKAIKYNKILAFFESFAS